MDNAFMWIAVAVAAAGLSGIISKKIPSWERWSWYISVLGGFGVLIVATASFWQSELELPPSRRVVQEMMNSATDTISSQFTCRLDSLEVFIEKALNPHNDRTMWSELAKEQALCLKDEARTLMDSCLIDLGLGRSDTVIIRLNPIIRNSQTDSTTLGDAHYLIGLAHSLVGEDTLALASYEAAMYSDPGHRKAYFARGLTLIGLGRTEELAQILSMPNPTLTRELTIPFDPDVNTYLSLADSLFRYRQYDGALTVLNVALAFDSLNVDALSLKRDIKQGRALEIVFSVVLAETAERENLLGRALEAYVHILELDSLDVRAIEGKRRVDRRLLVNRLVAEGLDLYIAGNYVRAGHVFDSVLTNDSGNPVAIHFNKKILDSLLF